jgi:hypothetical protein
VAQVSAAAATAVPPGEAFDPALYLGRLLDFHGSVELAALVDEPAPVPRSPASALRAGASSSQTPHSPPATVSNAEPALEGAVSDGHAALPERAARELKSSIATDFAAVRSQLGRAVARWTSPKSRVAGTLTLREALATRAALGTRERRTTTIAAAICAPLAEEARREIDATRSAARAIEGALLTELADRTERARRVASLASVVAQAMEPALRQRMHRLVDLVETRDRAGRGRNRERAGRRAGDPPDAGGVGRDRRRQALRAGDPRLAGERRAPRAWPRRRCLREARVR